MPRMPRKICSRACTRYCSRQRSKAVGKSLAEIDLGSIVEVTGVRRHGSRSVVPKAEDRFEEGDVVVLLGKPANLAIAERRLHRG